MALLQNGEPGEPCLCPIEGKKLKETLIYVQLSAPDIIVILYELRVGVRPLTATAAGLHALPLSALLAIRSTSYTSTGCLPRLDGAVRLWWGKGGGRSSPHRHATMIGTKDGAWKWKYCSG